MPKQGQLVWLWLTALVIVLDQASKYWFEHNLSLYEQIVVIPDLFSWTLAYNKGAAFSFLAEQGGWQRWFFAVIAVVASVALVIWLKRLKSDERWLDAWLWVAVLWATCMTVLCWACRRLYLVALAGPWFFPLSILPTALLQWAPAF